MRKTRKTLFDVSGFGKRVVIEATSVGNAVSKFARRFRIGLKADHESGGWLGIHVWPVAGRIRSPREVVETLADREKRLRTASA